MTGLWLLGLVRRRAGRLLAAAFGIAVAVALTASLGSFLAASKATMTARASRAAAVDWQVAVHPNASGGGLPQVLAALRHDSRTRAALAVGFADSPGLTATTRATAQTTTQTTTQTTGAAKVLGLPAGYVHTFPDAVRLLTGSLSGALVAQQTAANLHVRPGDTVHVARAGSTPFAVRVSGVVELPQADSLFQQVGAPPQSQPVAPPDNVLLLPAASFDHAYARLRSTRPDQVSTQVHVRLDHALPPDPAAAFVTVTRAAGNLQVRTSGVAVVGDNLGAVLDAAREDALYSQVLFLFLATPGAVLAGALTAAVAQTGAPRRRREQELLRARGGTTGQLVRLVLLEGVLTAVVGGGVGLLAALGVGRLAFGHTGFGSSGGASALWAGVSFVLGLAIAVVAIVLPARRDLVRESAARVPGSPRWLTYGLDLLLIACALGVLWAAGRNKYTLVLAPEGVPTLAVSYWAFLAPFLAWLGAGLFGWRLADLLLGRGRGVLARLLRPTAGNLAATSAVMMSRQRRLIARSAVLLGLAVSFAISTATFNATYRQQAEIDAQLTNGADVTVTTSPGSSTPPSYARRLAALPGVRAVQPVQHRFAYVGTDLQDLYGIDARTITRATTLQDAYFQGAGAAQMLRRLAAQPDAVLVSAETVNDFQLAPGDHLRLRLQDSVTHAFRTVDFRYAGIVNEFPTAPKDSFIVANASYLARQTGSAAVGTFLVDTGGAHLSSVAARVRGLVGPSAQVVTLDQARGQVGSSLTSVDLAGLTRLELAFALVIAAAAGGLLMGLGLNERRRGIAVATVLGATRGQVRRLLGGEPLFVVVVGVLLGVVAGGALSVLLVTVLTGVFDPPPATLAVPWAYLVALVATAAATIGVAWASVTAHARRHAREHLRGL